MEPSSIVSFLPHILHILQLFVTIIIVFIVTGSFHRIRYGAKSLRLPLKTVYVYIWVSCTFLLVYRREGTTHMMMFSRMLRRQGFYRVKNQDDPVYMKHGVGLGGIYVRIEHKKALIQVRDLGIQEEFTRVKKLENFINELEDQAYREKCFIVHRMRGSGS